MTEKTESKVICDNCGKKIDAGNNTDGGQHRTPLGWYRVERLSLFYRPKRYNKKYLKDRNKLDINEETDPDFCCQECAIEWFKKQLNKVTTIF